MSSFQYLNTEGLSHSEKKILKGRLYHEFEMITTDFSSLLNKTCELLIREGVSYSEKVSTNSNDTQRFSANST